MAMALMLCMPLLSRYQQGMEHAAQVDAGVMCLSEVSRTALAVEEQAGHALLHKGSQGHPADGGSPTQGSHLDHGAVCGYCVLATWLLPVLALALVVPLPPARPFGIPPLPATPLAPFWPAHTPRGPPLVS